MPWCIRFMFHQDMLEGPTRPPYYWCHYPEKVRMTNDDSPVLLRSFLRIWICHFLFKVTPVHFREKWKSFFFQFWKWNTILILFVWHHMPLWLLTAHTLHISQWIPFINNISGWIHPCCRYALAVEVESKRAGKSGTSRKLVPSTMNKKSFEEDELIYFRKSPDYCLADESVGSLGTTGR